MTQLGTLAIVEVEPQPKAVQEAINAMSERMRMASQRMCIPARHWIGPPQSEAEPT